MFRMNKFSFERLCEKICDTVGEEKFRPEGYLNVRQQPRTTEATMYVGGYIPGEVKLAVTLRMLAGSSYLDLLLVYSIGKTTVYDSFHEVVDWINETFTFQLRTLLDKKNLRALKHISSGFASFSQGELEGIIGAIDGIAIRIMCPTESDGISDPGNLYCRKQFYALNVQAVVDSKSVLIG